MPTNVPIALQLQVDRTMFPLGMNKRAVSPVVLKLGTPPR